MIDVSNGRAQIRVFEAGKGQDLVFFHGAGGLMPDDPFVARLAEHYRVHAPLLPGYTCFGPNSSPNLQAATIPHKISTTCSAMARSKFPWVKNSVVPSRFPLLHQNLGQD